MDGGRFFELNSWGLNDRQARHFAAISFSHDVAQLFGTTLPPCWPHALVNPCHLFACGVTRSGGMASSRRALESLLAKGANLDAVDASGWTPLSYAAWFGLASTLDILLEAGASVHPEGAPPPLTAALSSFAQRKQSGSETCARLLLMSGADPLRCSISDATGRSSFLSWALANEYLEWATLLHARGDKLRSDRELSVLTWQAGPYSLDWLQIHGYDVLSSLPMDHEHRPRLLEEQASRRRSALTDLASQAKNRSSIQGEEDECRRAI